MVARPGCSPAGQSERAGPWARRRWQQEPEEHDYPAAASYLSLIAPSEVVEATVSALRSAPINTHKAKDVLGASQLPLLPRDNKHVDHDLHKIAKNKPLSPVLIIRGHLTCGIPAQIADGYHRVCASYHVDENVNIPARIADYPR
ncbi:hypothetical protein CWC39_01215 [Corynebacterium heidelbergense]|uniref:Uncharacterized protein n=2 Tax=Corynebacterium heidelbergense TaxID=2055947 RepID=A0A364VDT2_9CORY|nr:hypothetical protein [Corynebacterium heidelbergense]RAV34822.1 hypothetical protein CWC39_01215 [Corynebacterium heidelbergense]